MMEMTVKDCKETRIEANGVKLRREIAKCCQTCGFAGRTECNDSYLVDKCVKDGMQTHPLWTCGAWQMED